MYEIVKNVITSKRYALDDMLKKIDTLWVQNDITEEQRQELVALAQANADPEQSNAPLQTQINELAKQQSILRETVTALRAAVQSFRNQNRSRRKNIRRGSRTTVFRQCHIRQVPSVLTAARSGNPWWIITSGSRGRLELARKFGKK